MTRAATPADVDTIVDHWRPRPSGNLLADTGAWQDPTQLMLGTLRASRQCHAIIADGEVAAIFGVARSRSPGVGLAWLQVAPAAARYARAWLRLLPGLVEIAADGWEALRFNTALDDEVMLRWLRRAGFHPFGLPIRAPEDILQPHHYAPGEARTGGAGKPH